MPLTLAQKLRIKKGMKLMTINAPASFSATVSAWTEKPVISQKEHQQIHWFVMSRAQMEKEVGKVIKLLKGDVVCWIYYPKGSSKIQTDLTRDKGWDALLKHKELQWLSLISFDDTWSAFGMRLKNEDDKKKEANAPATRVIFDFVDPVSKTVKLPADFAGALKKSKKANTLFDSLSFTNKKEYLEWIVTAKSEETRNERVSESILRLEKGWKNPRNM